MANIWLKTRIWTKAVLLGALVIFVLVFMLNNSGKTVEVWLYPGSQPTVSLLVLIFITLGIGVISTLLWRATVKTLRQVKEYRGRSRSMKLEREVAEMRTKAAMLQTKPEEPPAPSA